MKTVFFIILSIAVLFSGCTPGAAQLPTQTSQTHSTERGSLQYPENDPVIHLAYDPDLTGRVEGAMVPAVASSPNLPFTGVHPAFVQLRFPDYAKGRAFQLPFPIEAAQMIVFQTRDFASYENGGVTSYSSELDQLKTLVAEGIGPGYCAQPLSGTTRSQALPFLPLVNSAQVFCAKAQPVTFAGGKGIRYVTYYSQGMGAATDPFAFYTFQGLSDDGQYYLSAVLPIRTNILPATPPSAGAEPDLKTRAIFLKDQVMKINGQAEDGFTPSLSTLDALIKGVNITGE